MNIVNKIYFSFYFPALSIYYNLLMFPINFPINYNHACIYCNKKPILNHLLVALFDSVTMNYFMLIKYLIMCRCKSVTMSKVELFVSGNHFSTDLS